MQEENIQKIIDERMNQLPEIIRNEISNGDWEETIRKIVEKNDLLIDQALEIEKSTLMMMLGIENPKNYTKNIRKRANLSNEKAINIAYEVDEKILQRIKSKLVGEAEKEAGMENNPLKDILGPKQEIDGAIPDIDMDLEEDSETERNDLINELQGDIEIDEHDDDLEEINKQEKEWVEENQTPENLPVQPATQENKIPFREDNNPNPRIIETDFSKQQDNLPGLEPLRTLQSDSENKDDIVSSKLGGTTIKKTENKDFSENNQKDKNSGPDPYRESFE